MASSNESKPAKKRQGRKRLPPLAPGPSLQFVVANHPDDFKADDTMRNVRSHVMYKHRGEHRGESPGKVPRAEGSNTLPQIGTSSPTTTHFGDYLEDLNLLATTEPHSEMWDNEFNTIMSQSSQAHPLRDLVARIISATTSEPPQSASAMFGQAYEYALPGTSSMSQESIGDLRNLYLNSNFDMSQDRAWMEIVCSNRMSFLSHVSVACVYQDVAEGFLEDSALTLYAKTKLLRMIKESLQGYSTSMDDFTILSILYLLVSEIGGSDEDIFDVHHQGLIRIIHQRGGLNNLEYGSIATFLIVVILSFTVLRGHSEPAILHGFAPSGRHSTTIEHQAPPTSPLYPLHGDMSGIYGRCSDETYSIIHDMHELTQLFTAHWDYMGGAYPSGSSTELATYDINMQQIYTRLLLRPSSTDPLTADWVYESCRLTALIYCRSIVQGVPLAESANVLHARNPGAGTSGTTIVQALHNALEHTDKSRLWGNMNGVFFWVCLVGGAATWATDQSVYWERDEGQQPSAWIRKTFSLYAVKSAMAIGTEHAGAVVQAQRVMLQVQDLINLKGGITSR